jgi:two-component system chemotaxis sensor kinase CheA
VTAPPDDRKSDRNSDRKSDRKNDSTPDPTADPTNDPTADPTADDRMIELRQLFFETAAELVQTLNDEAMQLEKSPGDPATARSLRRTVHTLKGDAAACGFRELSELCHQFEDVLALANPATAASVPEIGLRAADLFAALLEAYRTGTKLPSMQSLRADIARLAHPAPPGQTQSPGHPSQGNPSQGNPSKGNPSRNGPSKNVPSKRASAHEKIRKRPARKTPWSEYEQLAIARALNEGRRVHHVAVDLDPQCGMPIAGRQMIKLALSGLGEVLALYPPEAGNQAVNRIEAALASEKAVEQIRTECSIPTIALTVKVSPVRSETLCPLPQPSAFASPGNNEQAATPVSKAVSEVAASAAPGVNPISVTLPDQAEVSGKANAGVGVNDNDAPSTSSNMPSPVQAGPDTLLRVDAEKIDSVLNLVGELILAKSMLQQALLEFAQRFPKDVLRGKFSDAMAFQGRVLNDLQHSVMKIRMVPVEQLFRRFPRVARDVGLRCGKEVELVVRGGQTDLDKSILDAIAEPLTHLVRNAIGHGIETPAERVRAGKPPQGMLRLGAYHQGNQVVIEVSDDGAGIDAEKVRQRAVSQGLLKAEQAALLSPAETLDLILQPGFSTAEAITELSGRGVGLDVVQSVLARLKGTIQIETALGKGTTFRLRLPLTLAIIRALMFRVEQRLYALPLNAVTEIARTVEENIHQVEHYDVLQLRNDVLPLLRLGSKPVSGAKSARSKIFVLVIDSGERKFGVVVDALEGEGELVIKALDDHSITTDLVSGASILGDGRVVLILSMIALMNRFTESRTNVTAPQLTGLLSTAADARSQDAHSHSSNGTALARSMAAGSQS